MVKLHNTPPISLRFCESWHDICIYNSNGNLLNTGFLDYRVPVASDLPMIETILVEVPNPGHPFGVRGVGETPIVPPLAAVANAVSNAIGKRMTDLPLNPIKIFSKINS